MDGRVKTLIGAAALLVVILAAVLIGRGGDDASDEPAVGGEKPRLRCPKAILLRSL